MDVKKLVQEMSLEEKASLCSGEDYWHTKAIERLGIPAIMMSDGPHGLRKQKQEEGAGINDSIAAVCFPCGCATAASFDRELIGRMGQAIGQQCQSEGVSIILGPAANIKRSPLCGRNFEYFSEDPYLASQMAAAHIGGVQSQGVGTSLKHYLANNQEQRRMSVDAVIDERTMREIYLAAFESAITEGRPWTVMCSYNRLNGEYVSESRRYLTDILRGELGYDGVVVSDWGAVNDRAKALEAGLELEMPPSFAYQNDAQIVEAVKSGKMSEAVLDWAAERLLRLVEKAVEQRQEGAVWDKQAHHLLAAEIEAQSMVLLKNEGILPLLEKDRVAFIGQFAKTPRYQGGGSSHINSFREEGALEAAAGKDILYADGYDLAQDVVDEALIAEAVAVAKQADVAVIFAGLPDQYESEAYDRAHMRMPKGQDVLIERVAEAQPNTVVVLHNGSPVEMPWVGKVKAVLEAYLGGQAVGLATVRVLYGQENPSGRLPESFPLRLEDNPSYLYFGGERDTAEYREGIFVGYRYYDKKKMPTLFPFGHGLSYTTFEYSNLRLNREQMRDDEELEVLVDVKNTGKCAGKEVVQLYVAAKDAPELRPQKELKGFEKILLQPGESKTVRFILGKRAFAYYSAEIGDWHVNTGLFDILIAKSAEQVVLARSIKVCSTVEIPARYTRNSTFGDVLKDPKAQKVLAPMIERFAGDILAGQSAKDSPGLGVSAADMLAAMMRDMPLRGALTFAKGFYSEDLEALLEQINKEE